jgi:hypothetical protein
MPSPGLFAAHGAARPGVRPEQGGNDGLRKRPGREGGTPSSQRASVPKVVASASSPELPGRDTSTRRLNLLADAVAANGTLRTTAPVEAKRGTTGPLDARGACAKTAIGGTAEALRTIGIVRATAAVPVRTAEEQGR